MNFITIICSDEAEKVAMLGYIRGLILGPFFSSVKLITLVVFVSFVYTGGVLRSEIVFVAYSLYQAVRLSLVLFVPFAIQFISDTKVTFKRIEVSCIPAFLLITVSTDSRCCHKICPQYSIIFCSIVMVDCSKIYYSSQTLTFHWYTLMLLHFTFII
jgi:hypothetical protein